MENKQGRYPKDHPRAGGFFVMWAQQTLNSKMLKNDRILATFVRVLAVAQLVDFQHGRFEKADMPLSPHSVSIRAGITVEQFNNLVDIGLVSKEVKNGEVFYFIKSWEEHQNPRNSTVLAQNKESDNNAEKNRHLKPNIHSSVSSSSSIKHHSSSIKSKYDSKSKKVEV